MSRYARNHLQDDWASHAHEETQRRIQAAEKEADWYFSRATRCEKAAFDAAMQTLFGMAGPRANRARERARTRWREATAEANTLCEATIACLLTTGEVSDALDAQWSALISRSAKSLSAAE